MLASEIGETLKALDGRFSGDNVIMFVGQTTGKLIGTYDGTNYFYVGGHDAYWQCTRPMSDLNLHLLVQKSSTGLLADAVTVIDTLNVPGDRAKVKAFNGATGMVACTMDGFGSAYSNATVIVDLSGIAEQTYLYYKWYTAETSLEWRASHFPVSSESDKLGWITGLSIGTVTHAYDATPAVTLTSSGSAKTINFVLKDGAPGANVYIDDQGTTMERLALAAPTGEDPTHIQYYDETLESLFIGDYNSGTSAWVWGNPIPIRGTRGPEGPTGAAGTNGTNGSDGERGVQGDQGNPGAKGDTGAQGPAGPQGTLTAATVYSASVAYAYLAVVTYNGSTYQCIATGGSTAGTLPTNTSVFHILAQAGTNGTNGANGLDGMSAWSGTQAEYNAITTPDPDILYIIIEG